MVGLYIEPNPSKQKDLQTGLRFLFEGTFNINVGPCLHRLEMKEQSSCSN